MYYVAARPGALVEKEKSLRIWAMDVRRWQNTVLSARTSLIPELGVFCQAIKKKTAVWEGLWKLIDARE